MARKRYTAEQIIGLFKQADVELGKGRKVPEVCNALGIREVTYDGSCESLSMTGIRTPRPVGEGTRFSS